MPSALRCRSGCRKPSPGCVFWVSPQREWGWRKHEKRVKGWQTLLLRSAVWQVCTPAHHGWSVCADPDRQERADQTHAVRDTTARWSGIKPVGPASTSGYSGSTAFGQALPDNGFFGWVVQDARALTNQDLLLSVLLYVLSGNVMYKEAMAARVIHSIRTLSVSSAY